MIPRSAIRSFVAGAALVLTGVLVTAHAEAPQTSHLNQILDRGSIRVGTTGDFNPMSVRDPATSGYKGFEIDAAQQLAKDLGVKLELVATDWPTMVAGVAANRYDVFMGGATMNVPRAKAIAFTIPYMETGTVPVFAGKNSARFKSWDDINQPGVVVAVVLGTVFEDQAKQNCPKATIKSVQPPANGYQEVLAGRADVAITSSIDAQSIVSRFPNLTHLANDQARNKRPFAYVTALNDFPWTNFLNSWIYLKTSEGFFAALQKKWGLSG